MSVSANSLSEDNNSFESKQVKSGIPQGLGLFSLYVVSLSDGLLIYFLLDVYGIALITSAAI